MLCRHNQSSVKLVRAARMHNCVTKCKCANVEMEKKRWGEKKYKGKKEDIRLHRNWQVGD